MQFRQFATDGDFRVVERGGDFGQKGGHPARRFVEHDRRAASAKTFERPRARLLGGGRKAFKDETVGRQTGNAEQRRHRRRTGHGDDLDAGGSGRSNQTVAGIGDRRGAGVADQRDALASQQTFEQARGHRGLVGVAVAHQRPRQSEVGQELAGAARVFGRDEIGLGQHAGSA